jgi:hypothetical protein
MPVHQVLYRSRRLPLERQQPDEIRSILATALRHNAANHVTGCLAHTDHWFLQVIEGSQDAVTSTYDRIARDPRHSAIQTLMTRQISNHSFPEWSMIGFDLTGPADPLLGSLGLETSTIGKSVPPSQVLMALMDMADRKRMGH